MWTRLTLLLLEFLLMALLAGCSSGPGTVRDAGNADAPPPAATSGASVVRTKSTSPPAPSASAVPVKALAPPPATAAAEAVVIQQSALTPSVPFKTQSTVVPTSTPASVSVRHLTAREAYPVAEAKVKSADRSFALYEIDGCFRADGSPGRLLEPELLKGRCAAWRVTFIRPGSGGQYVGLSAFVAGIGVLRIEDYRSRGIVPEQAQKQGKLDNWTVDSSAAMDAAEKGGGKEFREKYPRSDPARPDANPMAILTAQLQMHPIRFFVGQDYKDNRWLDLAGSKGSVWTINYEGGGFSLAIDGASSELLGKRLDDTRWYQ